MQQVFQFDTVFISEGTIVDFGYVRLPKVPLFSAYLPRYLLRYMCVLIFYLLSNFLDEKMVSEYVLSYFNDETNFKTC